MTPKEIRKLQRNKRRLPSTDREAVSFANACAFATPGPTPSPERIERWAARWTLMFEEGKAKALEDRSRAGYLHRIGNSVVIPSRLDLK